MPWARASALDRHLECAAASWLPRADRGAWEPGYLSNEPAPVGAVPPDDKTLADWGTAMHLAKEGHPLAADPWLSWMEPVRDTLWPPSLGVHELPFALCCRTGLLNVWTPADGDKDAWKRSRGPSYVTGETDWWARLPGGEPWVDDLKTGWVAPAATIPQMLLYALVAAQRALSPTVRVSVTHWRRGWEEPERKWLQVGPATLEAFKDDLFAAYRRACAGPVARAGTHCRYCPSASVCPTVTGQENK